MKNLLVLLNNKVTQLFAFAFVFSATALSKVYGQVPTCPELTEAQKLAGTPDPCIQVDEGALGFQIPNLSDILTFAIRAIFVIGGLLALVMLLLGAISWITSGGEKENVSKAQNKLQAAVVGVILIAVVLAIIATLEQVIFKGTICLGLTCPITVPDLLEPVQP